MVTQYDIEVRKFEIFIHERVMVRVCNILRLQLLLDSVVGSPLPYINIVN